MLGPFSDKENGYQQTKVSPLDLIISNERYNHHCILSIEKCFYNIDVCIWKIGSLINSIQHY